MKRIEEIYESTVVEKDEHRKSKEYRKLSPKMKDAVDSIFKVNYDYDIFEIISIDYQYTPTSEYPSSKRDLSFSVKNLGNIENYV